MTGMTTFIGRAGLLATAAPLAILIAGLPSMVQAQTSSGTVPPTTEQTADGSKDKDIVVTGSLFRRTDTEIAVARHRPDRRRTAEARHQHGDRGDSAAVGQWIGHAAQLLFGEWCLRIGRVRAVATWLDHGLDAGPVRRLAAPPITRCQTMARATLSTSTRFPMPSSIGSRCCGTAHRLPTAPTRSRVSLTSLRRNRLPACI